MFGAHSRASTSDEWRACTDDESQRDAVALAVQHCLDGGAALSLTAMGLARLPVTISKQLVKFAQILQFAQNDLTALPAPLGMLRGLLQLHANNNEISSLAEEICTGCANLQVLLLHNNRLESLPPRFGALRKLHTLTLTFNKLRALPASFRELEALQKLSLSHNQLWPSTLEGQAPGTDPVSAPAVANAHCGSVHRSQALPARRAEATRRDEQPAAVAAGRLVRSQRAVGALAGGAGRARKLAGLAARGHPPPARTQEARRRLQPPRRVAGIDM